MTADRPRSGDDLDTGSSERMPSKQGYRYRRHTVHGINVLIAILAVIIVGATDSFGLVVELMATNTPDTELPDKAKPIIAGFVFAATVVVLTPINLFLHHRWEKNQSPFGPLREN